MQLIRTRYLCPTETRGSRILASVTKGLRVSVAFNHELSDEGNHEYAAYALAKKLQWNLTGEYGSYAEDRYWLVKVKS